MKTDRKQLIQTGAYEQLASATQHLENLQAIAKYNTEEGKRASHYAKRLIISVMLSFIAVLVLFLTEPFWPSEYYTTALQILGGSALACWTYVGYADLRLNRSVDRMVDASRSDLANAVLQLLRVDLRQDRPVRLHLDLGDLDTDANKVRWYYSPGGRWEVTEYLAPWLECSSKLLDGSRFKLTVARRLRKCFRTKREHGKAIPVLKVKWHDRVRLHILPPNELAVRLQYSRQEFIDDLKIPAYAALRSTSCSNEGLVIELGLEQDWGISSSPSPGEVPQGCAKHAIAMMFLSISQTVNRERGRLAAANAASR